MWEEQEELVNQICLGPWESDSGFHVEIHLALFFLKKLILIF